MSRLAELNSSLTKTQGELELKIQAVRDKYKAQIEEMTAEINQIGTALELWAMNNTSEFGKKKSIEWMHGTIGYRTGNWRVEVSRGLSNKIVGILKAAGMEQYLRLKEELDKERILSEKEDAEKMNALRPLGIEVVQEEKFFIETKTEELV